MKNKTKYWLILIALIFPLFISAQQNPNCLSFDGINDYISLGNNSKLQPVLSLTVEAWVNLNNWNASNTEEIVSTFFTYGYQLKFKTDTLQAVVYRNGSAANASFNVSSLSGWHHVAFTYDGRYIRLYLDGVLKKTNDAGATYPIRYNSSYGTVIGANSNGTSEYLKGKIDEVRIWSAVRTASQLLNNMNTELTTSTANLVAYYRFNQGTANGSNSGQTTLNDLTSNVINGTLINFALTGSSSNWTNGYPLKPIDQSSNVTYSNVQANQVTISWTRPGLNKGGNSVKVFMKQTTTGSASPVDGTNYTANTSFGSGTQIGATGWYCIYDGSDTSVTVTNLLSNTAYRTNVIEYQSVTGLTTRYSVATGTGNPANKTTDMSAPTVQATNLTFSSITATKYTVTWTRGNGSNCIVFVNQTTNGTASPVINTTYTANSAFGNGSQIGTTGWYCVYKGDGASVTITGVNSNTTYRTMVCEYNGSAASENYLTISSTNNPKNQTTDFTVPTTQASSINFVTITGNTFIANWTRGNGSNCIVFVKSTSTGNAAPVNNTTYTANSIYGNGSQISSTGWYCVYKGAVSSVNITGMNPGTTYRVMVCEYNGTSGFEKYLTSTSTNNPNNQITDFLTPSIQASNIVFSSTANTTFKATWTRGNGSNCIAFVKQTNNDVPLLSDKTTYTANATFKSGSQLGTSGWYCVYKGSSNTVTVKGLNTATTYKMMVFEFNGTAGNEKYNTNTSVANPNLNITLPITTWNGTSWNNGAPTSGTAVVIAANYNQTINIICNSLYINNNAVLNVMPGIALTVNSDFTNYGTLNLKSPLNNTESGSFIAYGQIANFGTMNAERYIAPSTLQSNDRTWHTLSAPISNYSEGMTYSVDYVCRYLEASNTWVNLKTGDSIYRMKGYLVKTTNSGGQVLNFNGTFNTGTQQIPVINSKSDALHGYNSIGNPYPSAIDWNASTGWTKTNITGTIWIWNPVTQVYATWDGTVGTNGGSQYIPAMQGFLVQVSEGNSSGLIGMTDAIRVHSTQTFLKSGKVEPELIRLKTSGNNFSDELVFYKSNGPNTAYKLFSDSVPVPQIYNIDENSLYSIFKVSPDISDTTFQIGFRCIKSGEYSISADQITFDTTKLSIYLIDNATNNSIRLSPGTTYKFDYIQGENEFRFNLQIKSNQNNITLVKNDQNESIKVWSYSNNIYFIIPFEGLSKIFIYDAIGRNILTKDFYNKGTYNLELSKSGIYFVNVNNNGQTYNKKVFVK